MTVDTGLPRNSWGQYPQTKGTTTSVLALKGLPRVRRKRRRRKQRKQKRRM